MDMELKKYLIRVAIRYRLRLHRKAWLNIRRLENEPKVFCLSMQRTGTTSVGKFLRDFGYRWAGWPLSVLNNWSSAWYEGDYESIFRSTDFRVANAFEDDPWWFPGFYEVLHQRFPQSKFILFERDPDAWFKSMVRHSGGNILGRTRTHCRVYNREEEYHQLLQRDDFDERLENTLGSTRPKAMKLIGHDEHYKTVYRNYNQAIKTYFQQHAPEALHVDRLENPAKWQNLGNFLGFSVPDGYVCHQNLSRPSPAQ